MIRGNIYGRDVKMAGSPYAMLVFKREFGEHLPEISRDVRKRYIESEEIDIASLLGICWAMCKSFDDYGTPCFSQWYADFNFYNNEIPDDIGEAIIAFDQILHAIDAELSVDSRPYVNKTDDKEQDNNNQENSKAENNLKDWIEWKNILSLLNLGFSLDDIKHMPMKDFIAYTDIIAIEHEEIKKSQEPQIVEATQDDIDRFFF